MDKAYVCARRSGSNILLKACLILHDARAMTLQCGRNLLETFCFNFPGRKRIDGGFRATDAQDRARGRQESTNEAGIAALNL
ncbi:hypothetical protein [Pseudomonas fluorescens]|uniref:hypothetical protein n=1 Tax=Pseudomonas fluorescens TaxID=294 RepID=UPI001071C0E5|nr:hypothetical protein [Pseudomonas fluorescens]